MHSAADTLGKAQTFCDVPVVAAGAAAVRVGEPRLGAFTVIVGLLSRSHTIFDYLWFTIGLFLLLEGAWVLRVATLDPRVLQLEAAALLLIGLWNTVGLYFEIESGMKPVSGARIIFVGIVQLISAYTTLRSYPTYKQIYEHLNRACLHELEIKIGDMWKRKTQEGADLAEFKANDKKSKAKFLPDLVIVLTQDGKQIAVAGRGEVKIENIGNKMLSKLLKGQVTLEGEKLKTEMNPECYERWQTWLSQNSGPASPA